jgi:hypothetical protein
MKLCLPKLIPSFSVLLGGVANAYIPTAEEEERARLQEAELMRVRTQDRDRIKEIEHERQELRNQEPST